MRKLIAALFLIGITATSTASAQTCLGLPSFASSRVHVNAAIEFPDSATVYAAGVGAGTHNSLFATIGGGVVTFEGLDNKAKFGFLEFGYQLPLGKAQICPVAGGTFATGPDAPDEGLKVTSRSVAAGAAIGYDLRVSMLHLIPNASVKYNYTSVNVDEESIGSETQTATATIADLGLALVFAQRISIQPIVHLPLTGNDKKATYGIFLSVAVSP